MRSTSRRCSEYNLPLELVREVASARAMAEAGDVEGSTAATRHLLLRGFSLM